VKISSTGPAATTRMARSLEAEGEEERAVEVLTAGLARAQADGNDKASGELDAYRSQLA